MARYRQLASFKVACLDFVSRLYLYAIRHQNSEDTNTQQNTSQCANGSFEWQTCLAFVGSLSHFRNYKECMQCTPHVSDFDSESGSCILLRVALQQSVTVLYFEFQHYGKDWQINSTDQKTGTTTFHTWWSISPQCYFVTKKSGLCKMRNACLVGISMLYKAVLLPTSWFSYSIWKIQTSSSRLL